MNMSLIAPLIPLIAALLRAVLMAGPGAAAYLDPAQMDDVTMQTAGLLVTVAGIAWQLHSDHSAGKFRRPPQEDRPC
ncbi:hypothetical protein [Rhizobium leguminosarum]|uniref:hypothetical protein n=1 Tax=Rhizobium leguminosarum TaxID=384 RepID=UPI0014411A79|nr:hypothetical protein [Rhizobium leguminosarum]NKL63285.1 hypothetical protein [Rhizobium leguminosarum bv. viciae]